MALVLLILSSFLTLSYSQSLELDNEIVPKQFVPSGSIEALIDDYNETYYLVQLDLKNDSLYNIANSILNNSMIGSHVFYNEQIKNSEKEINLGDFSEIK